MKIKSKVISAMMAFALVFGVAALVGVGEGYAYTDEPVTVAPHTGSTYAQQAPITTITIDKTRLTKDYLKLNESGKPDQEPRNGVEFTYNKDDGYVYAENIPVNGGYKWMGNFTLIYKGAAILSDGVTKKILR